MSLVYGGIEAGGTKFVCAVATGPDQILAESRIPTTEPGETIGRAIEFLRNSQLSHGPLSGVGIGSFGPVDPDPKSPTYGYITSTPKGGWANIDLAGPVGEALGIPVGFDTDVNGAALAEHKWGAAQNVDSFVYLTIGTGIGGGVMMNGQLAHGLVHPEMGHIRVPRDLDKDPFEGSCPYHGDCLEGLASGPAIGDRWGRPSDELPEDHPAWELEARYLALAIVNFICTLSPKKVIMGGGVMARRSLFPLIQQNVQELLDGYIRSPLILESINSYIVPPGLGTRSGVLGAIALGQKAVAGT
jgi:fructokinase